MNDTDSNELSGNIVNNFLVRRYAQIYVEKFQDSKAEAEAWIRSKDVSATERPMLQEFVIEELKKKGYTNIKPGGTK